MTFYLSRYVRDDVSKDQFIEGLFEYLSYAMKDPQNNVSEFDKSITTMLERKIFCCHNPASGLMFDDPCITTTILTNRFLMYLLFYQRVFQHKHKWPTVYLSPISRFLCEQNLLSKLPSIYMKHGREIDLNQHIMYISTCDYFFISLISYPIQIGPLIPKILNNIYSRYKYEKEMESIKKGRMLSSKSFFGAIISSLWNKKKDSNNDIISKIKNPFKRINIFYAQIFHHYLHIFLPQKEYSQHPLNVNDTNRLYQEYGIKFIEIIGELWFGQTFKERPIGDRYHTLPLMQDLLYRIMEKQIDFQINYISPIHHQQSSLFGLGKIPKTSCICPELRCLLRYLYLFFRESFEHFPLDFIAHLRIIIEMLLYVISPWSIQYKFKNPDKNIKFIQNELKYKMIEKQKKQEKENESLLKIFSNFLGIKMNRNSNSNPNINNIDDNMHNKDNKINADFKDMIFLNCNDDRIRSYDLNINITEFDTADKLIQYELDGIDSNFNILIWKQYIIEMLPFYSCLINYFIDTLLKYDFGHPLKQLPVLKVLHIYQNKEIINLISKIENIIFNPYHNAMNQNAMNDINTNSEPLYIMNIIQDITFKRINDYRCLPFHDLSKQIQIQQQQEYMIHSQQITHSKAHHLYIKCRKVMTRLCPKQNNIEYKQEEEEDDDDNNNDEEKTEETQIKYIIIPYILSFIQYIISLIICYIIKTEKEKERIIFIQKQMPYFLNPSDNVKIIRYIIGELELLFNIGPQQQENLMNVSIMYEPSQSVTTSPSSYLNIKKQQQQQKRKEIINNNINNNIWNKPKGEYESYYALKINQIFYNVIIKNSKINEFYLKYLSIYHRIYLTDKRWIGWISSLIITYLFCHYLIFYINTALFISVVILSNTTNY